MKRSNVSQWSNEEKRPNLGWKYITRGMTMLLCTKINIVLRKGDLGRKGQVVMVTNASDNKKVRHREG